jgi:hypothetical protein
MELMMDMRASSGLRRLPGLEAGGDRQLDFSMTGVKRAGSGSGSAQAIDRAPSSSKIKRL